MTLVDEMTYLEVTVGFKDGSSMHEREFSPSAFLYENPGILESLVEGSMTFVELAGILTGFDSLDLLIKLLMSERRISDISFIDWNLTVFKDSESLYTMQDIVRLPHILEVLETELGIVGVMESEIESEIESGLESEVEDDNSHHPEVGEEKVQKVSQFLAEIFSHEVECGFNPLPYVRKASMSGSLEDIVPYEYTVDYCYRLDTEKMTETFEIVFDDSTDYSIEHTSGNSSESEKDEEIEESEVK